VRAWAPGPDAESRLRPTVEAAWPALSELGLAPGASTDNMVVTGELAEAVGDADYVQESAPEQRTRSPYSAAPTQDRAWTGRTGPCSPH